MAAKKVAGAGYRRKELGEYLPLETPFALHIFASHRCNLKCGYCLHSLNSEKIKNMGFKKLLMNYKVFEKCIDDATQFPGRFKVVIFAGWGEPLAHPDIARMVALVKSKNIADRIEIVSNGVLLTNDLTKDLITAGLDRIRISIQGIDSESCSKVTNVSFDFDSLVKNIAFFYTHRKQAKVYVKIIDRAVPTAADQKRFHQIFDLITDEIAIEHIIPVIRDIDHSKFGKVFDKRHCGGQATRVSVCPFPYYMSVIHPDGNYAPCCSPECPMILGNIKDLSIANIWNGSTMRNFRIAHLEGKRGDSAICQSCPRPQYDIQPGDNVDSYAQNLLPLYKIC